MKKMLMFAAILVVLFGAIAFVSKSENSFSNKTEENVAENTKKKYYYQNKISLEELKKQLQDQKDMTVYFYQTDCVHCAKISPVIVPMAKDMNIDMKVLDLQQYSAG
jgi:thiol:disulfide interchange protein